MHAEEESTVAGPHRIDGWMKEELLRTEFAIVTIAKPAARTLRGPNAIHSGQVAGK
jgi:hypothetical protein